MKKLSIILALLLCAVQAQAGPRGPIAGAIAATASCASSWFEDAFTRADNGTVGGSWTSETDTGSLLAISSNALVFTHSATTAGHVNYDGGTAHREGWVQFTVKHSDIDTGGSGQQTPIRLYDAGGSTGITIQFDNNAGGVLTNMYLRMRDDANSETTIDTWAISPAPQDNVANTIKIYYKAAASSGGIIDVYWDGTRIINHTGLAFDTYGDIDEIRFGNVTSAWTNTSLVITYDSFEWRTDDCFD